MYQLIASPFLGNYFVLKPGVQTGVKIPAANFNELQTASEREADCPQWLVSAAKTAWSMDLSGQSVADTVTVRQPAALEFGRARG